MSNNLIYDPQEDKKIYNFYFRGDKLRTTEIILVSLSIIILAAVIGFGIYCFIERKFIFDTYERTEGPPGTVSGKSTKHLLTDTYT